MKIRQRILARLLHYANASPPHSRQTFYDLKKRLLYRFGTFHGHDWQEIRKDCWGERRWNYQDYDPDSYEVIPCGPGCRRCGGTGIFDIRWVQLERWEWCGYVFHMPNGDTRTPPDVGTVKIFGRIEHRDYGDLSNEACLWLYLLCGEWRLLWHSLRSSCRYGWYWWPLMNVQRVVMKLTMRLSWRKCWCGRWFPTCGSGWQVCRRCRNPKRQEPEQEIPF